MSQVSVIIPVYNGEKYLSECLDSVLGQSLKDIEIIIVDDGSTDSTPEILEDYCKRDDRISVYRQQNRYAGVARNLGKSHATGEYLVFWDADDYFEPDALEKMYTKMSENQADLCLVDAIGFDDETGNLIKKSGYVIWSRIPKEEPFSSADLSDKILTISGNFPWNKMFRRAFIEEQGLNFQEVKIANDTYFSLMTVATAARIVTVHKALIHYRMNIGVSRAPSENAKYLTAAYEYTRDELVRRGLWENENLEKSYYNKAMGSIMYLFEKEKTYDGFINLYNFFKESGFSRIGIKDRGEDFFVSERRYNEFVNIYSMDETHYMHYLYSLKLEDLSNELNSTQKKLAELKKEKKSVEEALAKSEKEKSKLEKEKEKIKKDKENIEQSRSYKLGRTLTSPARKMRKSGGK